MNRLLLAVVMAAGFFISTNCRNCNASVNSLCASCDPSDINSCTSCISQFYLDTSNASNSTCLFCGAGCLSCSNNTVCLTCAVQSGWYLQTNGTCYNDGCGSYSYRASNQTCLDCGEGCWSCSNGTACGYCHQKSGYYLNQTTGSCYKDCHLTGCNMCEVTNNNESACYGCSMGYFETLINCGEDAVCANCTACPTNCSVCNTTNACTTCAYNLTFNAKRGICSGYRTTFRIGGVIVASVVVLLLLF